MFTAVPDAGAQPVKVTAMPEITDSEFRQYAKYQTLGTPEEIWKKQQDLEKDNKDQRDELRVAKEAMPKEGEVTVTKARGESLTKYEALGKPDDVKSLLEKGVTAATALAATTRRSAAAMFAKLAGLAEVAVDALVAIPDLSEATFEVKKGKVKDKAGKEVETDLPYMTLAGVDGAAGESLLFTDAQERFPALKGLRLATKEEIQGTPPIVPFIDSGAPGHEQTGDVYTKIREEAAARQKKKDEAASYEPGKSPLEGRLGMTPSV